MVTVYLGQKNYKAASMALANVLSLNTIISLLFMAVMLLFLDPVLMFFGASQNTLPYARDYMTIILLGHVITHLYFRLNNLIRASGHPKLAMGVTIFTVATNAILGPIFIYVLGMGIKGAALATVICQALALVGTMRFFMDKKNFLHFPKGLFKLDLKIARDCMTIGMGPFLMNAAACLVTMFINQQLGKYGGDLAIAAYGIINRITFLFMMIVMGLTQGMQPIAGYNYGAGLYSRVREVFSLTVKWALLVTTAAFLVSELAPSVAVGIFTSDPSLKDIAVHGLRVMNCAFALVGFGMVTGNFFQCLGLVRISIFLSLSRQLIFLVPLIYFLPLFFSDTGVWLSFPISDILSVIVSAIMLSRLFRKFKLIESGKAEPSILGSQI